MLIVLLVQNLFLPTHWLNKMPLEYEIGLTYNSLSHSEYRFPECLH